MGLVVQDKATMIICGTGLSGSQGSVWGKNCHVKELSSLSKNWKQRILAGEVGEQGMEFTERSQISSFFLLDTCWLREGMEHLWSEKKNSVACPAVEKSASQMLSSANSELPPSKDLMNMGWLIVCVSLEVHGFPLSKSKGINELKVYLLYKQTTSKGELLWEWFW